MGMIAKVIDFISAIQKNLDCWNQKKIDCGKPDIKPWFRGESGNEPDSYLCPKIARTEYNQHNKENFLLQSFRRQAGGLSNVPDREHTDEWLFLAQHYGVPTRLLDWTEGALHALYFALNRENPNPRVYMLNPRKLNELAKIETFELNYPLSWANTRSALYVDLAWGNRKLEDIKRGQKNSIVRKYHYLNTNSDKMDNELKEIDELRFKIPIAFPATYRDQRMIAQRSCFTIHGEDLKPIKVILEKNGLNIYECLFEYKIDFNHRNASNFSKSYCSNRKK